MKVLVINGANINMLGIREKELYGSQDYGDLKIMIFDYCRKNDIDVTIEQSNHEGELIDIIQQALNDKVDAIVINAGAYTHTSIGILDALKAVNIPTVEVHITDIANREEFRKFSYISLYAEKCIIGHGLNGYIEALEYLKEKYGN